MVVISSGMVVNARWCLTIDNLSLSGWWLAMMVHEHWYLVENHEYQVGPAMRTAADHEALAVLDDIQPCMANIRGWYSH